MQHVARHAPFGRTSDTKFFCAVIVTVRAKIVRKSENGGGRDGGRLDVEAVAGLGF